MTSENSFIQECLDRSNYHRRNHGVDKLTLNDELCSMAQEWANKLASSSSLQHNKYARYQAEKVGENIAYSYNSARSPSASSMIDQWYNEVEKYNFNKHVFTSETGHFTQLVWKDSKEVGFGLVVKNGRHYLVADYFPAGNFLGEFDKNVFPRGKHSSDNSTDSGGRGSEEAEKKSPVGGFISNFFTRKTIGDAQKPNLISYDSRDPSPSRSPNHRTFDISNMSDRNCHMDTQPAGEEEVETTVETKTENGMRITTTTTVTKTAHGSSTKTSIRKEYL